MDGVNESADRIGRMKDRLRRWAKIRRATLVTEALSRTLTDRLLALPEMEAARHVLLYLAASGEVCIDALAERCGDGKTFYVPRVARTRQLSIHAYLPGQTVLRPGTFGIREPDPAQAPEADPVILDLVIVPSLALSERGDRLGYGGGYYDRFLPRLSPRTVSVGVLPDALVLPTLPTETWDRPLSVVMTEKRVLRPANRGETFVMRKPLAPGQRLSAAGRSYFAALTASTMCLAEMP